MSIGAMKFNKTQRALEHLNKKRTTCIKLHAALPELKANPLPDDDELIAILEQNINKMHFNYGLEKQVMLEAQLAGLNAEIEFLKEHLPEEV